MYLYELNSSNLHTRIFQFLRGNGLIRTKGDFCQYFLGKSRGYLAAIECLERSPSRSALVTLRSRLAEQTERPLHDGTKQAIASFIAEIDQFCGCQ